MLQLPIGCLQLIRATELLLHNEDEEYMDGANVKRCVPKETAKYSTFGFDTQYFLSAISANFKKLSSETITKAITITKMLTVNSINDTTFAAAMHNEKERLMWFKNHLNNDCIYFIWSSQWKSTSFNFVFHRTVRPNDEEERIRISLYKTITYSAALLCSIVFEYLIKICETDPDTYKPDERKGRRVVAENYARMRGRSAISKWMVKLEELPAVEDFYKTREGDNKTAPKVLPEFDLE